MTGVDYQPGVPFYVADAYSYLGNKYAASKYDSKTGIIAATLFYNIGGGQGFTPLVETIKLNFDTTPASVKKAAKKQVPSVKMLRGMSKKANIASPWSHYTKQAPQRVTKNSAPQHFLLSE